MARGTGGRARLRECHGKRARAWRGNSEIAGLTGARAWRGNGRDCGHGDAGCEKGGEGEMKSECPK